MEKPYKIAKNGIILNTKIIPRARKNEIVEILNNEVKLKIHSPPIEGKANAEIIKFFASIFKIPKSNIEIIRGASSSHKSIFLYGISKEKIEEVLSKYK